MRLILRVVGTWLLAMALILLIIDGTKSLGANALLWTPLAETWIALHPNSLAAVREFLASRFFGLLLGPTFESILGFPGFLVLGVPGIVIGAAGRSRRTRILLRSDQV